MPGDPAREGTGEGEVLSASGPGPRLDWRRLGAEFLVIVTGVLVALAVDDWARARDDRALEVHILETLVTDLDASAQDLREAITSARARGWCAQWILSEIGDPAGPSPHDFAEPDAAFIRRMQDFAQTGSDLATCLTLMGYVQVFDLRDAAFTELQSSGNLAVIRDPVLRERVVRFHGDMSDFQESNTIHRAYMHRTIEALQSAGIVIGDWAPDAQLMRRLAASRDAVTAIRQVVPRAHDQILAYEMAADGYGAFRVAVQSVLEDLP